MSTRLYVARGFKACSKWNQRNHKTIGYGTKKSEIFNEKERENGMDE